MRILLTNDDGIHAEGMQVLLEWAKTLGEVMVAAPTVEQSAKSHAIEIHKPFGVHPATCFEGVRAYSVDSTPADCVRWAILGLKEQFDLVISGVNRGLNIGRDIIYSGTVSAAFEASALGVKSLAVSTGFDGFDAARAYLPTVWDYMKRHALWEKGGVYNVNIPCEVTGDIRITRQGGPYYSDDFLPMENEMYRPSGKSVYVDSGALILDTDATLHGHITVTPLTYDRTDWRVYDEIVKLNP